MKTIELIEKLSAELTPVRKLPSLGSRALVIFVLAFSLSLVGFCFFSVRPDLDEIVRSGFLPSLALPLLALVLLLSFSLALAGTPGRADSRVFARRALLVFIGLSAALLTRLLMRGQTEAGGSVVESGFPCALGICLVSLAPAAGLFLWLRRQAPTQLALTGACIGFASAILATVSFQFFCPHNESLHLLGSHFLVPVLVWSGLGALLGRFLLRW